MAKTTPHRSSKMFWGLVWFLLMTLSWSSFMLLVNCALVFGLYANFSQSMPQEYNLIQLWQFLIFALPSLLLFLEWRIWDWVSERWGNSARRRTR